MNDLSKKPDTQNINVNGIIIEVVNIASNSLLNAFCDRFSADGIEPIIDVDLILEAKQTGLHCTWLIATSKSTLDYYVDIEKFVKQQFSYPAAKQGAFNQAIGKKTNTILDATGGWGGDALLMCAQGYTVTILERNPIMALLLEDAMLRLSETNWVIENQIVSPKVINIDAIDYFKNNDVRYDCVYLDPMFPPKRKKSAATNKNMQLLHWLIGEDVDAENLADKVIASNCSRLVVKRPNYAEPLLDEPSVQFSSKLVHYDVYLKF